MFISFTNSQNDTIKNIIDYKKTTGNGSQNYLVTTMANYPNNIIYQNICFLVLDKSINSLIKEVIFKGLKKQIDSFLSTNISKNNIVEILTPHLMNIPSNYIVHKLKKSFNKVIVFSNYPDGIGQLINTKIEYTRKMEFNIFQVIIRMFIGFSTGFIYKPVLGTILSQYQPLNNLYTYSKNLIEKRYRQNSIKIGYTKKKY